jgi:hypothetical protein
MRKHQKRIREYCAAAAEHFGATALAVKWSGETHRVHAIHHDEDFNKVAQLVMRTSCPVTVQFFDEDGGRGVLLFTYDPTSEPKEVLVDCATRLGEDDLMKLMKAVYRR